MVEGGGLLAPEFVRELEVLSRRLAVNARSGAAGERTAPRRGGSAEFKEHRPYSAGDDLRRVDWAAYARTGEPHLKLFRAEEDVVVRLVVDASASLAFGEPSKFDVARRVAAAIAYLALASGQRAQIFSARQAVADVSGRALERLSLPRRGRSALPALLRELSEATASGTADLGRALEQVLRQSARPGLLVVLSDFFDEGDVSRALSRAAAAGHELALVQVLSREELEPSLDGDYCFVDAESDAELELSLDVRALNAYTARLAALCEQLRGWAKKHRGSYVRLVNEDALEGAVRRFVAREID